MSDEFSPDGQPIQAGLQHRSVILTGNVPSYAMFGLHEMVVIDRKYVKQPGNRSRAQVEYTCRDLVTGDILIGCRRLDVMSGLTNGDDNVLHPATKLRPGAPGKFNRQSPAQDTDGDRVLVGFIEGSRQRPVIIGVFRHSFATYGAQESNGERRLTIHNGAQIEIDKDGNVRVQPAPGKDVFIGDQGATENLVLGQKFKQFASDLIDALLTATYPTGTGPSGPMLPPESATLTNLKAALDTLLSDMAFTQKEQT